MMTPENHEQQAGTFTRWHKRHGGDLDINFDTWADSKDLLHADRLAIRVVVLELLTAEGAAPPDVMWWLEAGGAA
jgi:hypothetical protein